MIKEITSSTNPLVKRIISLSQKARNRRKEGLFVVEGIREVERALKSGYNAVDILFSDDWVDSEIKEFSANYRCNLSRMSSEVFQKIAYRGRVKNVIALFEIKENGIKDLRLSDNSLVVVLERVEKPGNLGAVLRSANAAGVEAVFVCDQEMDIYNPNVIRNSLGGFFDIPVIVDSSEVVIEYLKKNNFQILTTYLEASKPYYKMDMTKRTAIVMGSESHGVSDIWLDSSDQNIIIPMHGIVDSLNVSNAASIVMFEASRQRMIQN